MKIIGKILCAIGLHKERYFERWNGMYRPHFECLRKGCNYWKE